jgi:methenyltetrahydromethanopterin cyclohydrolase
MLQLNSRTLRYLDAAAADAEVLHIHSFHLPCGARILDAGVQATGGLRAGVVLARSCLADLGKVSLLPGADGRPCVQVWTDEPWRACLGAQYAGWAIQVGKYFAMGSGPMRAAAGTEAVIRKLELAESAEACVGILESRHLPGDDVATMIAGACRIPVDRLTLLVAPTASLAGTVQVVARSVETALHKLEVLGFDVRQVASAWGVAPLPPLPKGDLAAIGRTNDAILYGAQVQLWVRGNDDELTALGPKVPAAASADYGAPFAEIFRKAGHDFYKIDPLLFSPARVTFNNVTTGRSFAYGQLRPDIVEASFAQG